MGMSATYKQIEPDTLNRLIADHSLVHQAWKEGIEAIDIDKAWHGIHFVLTGEAAKDSSIQSRAIVGGKLLQVEKFKTRNEQDIANLDKQVQLDYTYYLLPDEVAEAATALARISENDFRKMYDADELIENAIYPQIWDSSTDDELENYLLPNFRELVKYYQDAAKRGNGMLAKIG